MIFRVFNSSSSLVFTSVFFFFQLQTGNARFAYDSYRRFLEMFGDVVVGIPHHNFAKELDALKLDAGVWEDKDLSADQLKVSPTRPVPSAVETPRAHVEKRARQYRANMY